MKNLIRAIRPAYASQLLNRKFLSANLLDEAYDKLNKKVGGALRECKYFSIVNDGRSNVRFDHFVNIINTYDGKKPLFYNSIDTSSIVHSSEKFFADICEVIQGLEALKVESVSTDNANCMKKALDLIEEKYPKLFRNGCAAHTMSLIIQDHCDTDQNSGKMNKAKKLVHYIKERLIVLAKHREIKADLKIEKHICLLVPTRFHSRYQCVRGLLDNKGVITFLSINYVFIEVRNHQMQKRDEVLDVVRDPNFWEFLRIVGDMLCSPSQKIGKFEKNSIDI